MKLYVFDDISIYFRLWGYPFPINGRRAKQIQYEELYPMGAVLVII